MGHFAATTSSHTCHCGSTLRGYHAVMTVPPRILLICATVAAAVPLAPLSAQRAAPSQSSANSQAAETARIVTAAKAVLASLDEAGRAKVQFPFDSPQKAKWSNLPSGIFERDRRSATSCAATRS
jgi:hypothetical protein